MKRLIVLATGVNGSPKQWNFLLKQLEKEEEFADSEWLVFSHYGFWNIRSFSNFFTKSIETLSLELKAKIDQKWLYSDRTNEPYEEVILIGHSIGGLLVRQAYLIAAGVYPQINENVSEWTANVKRFVLLASINNGFEPDNFFLSKLVNLSNATGLVSSLRDTLKGSAFITNLRISWIRYFSDENVDDPIMIQVLGTEDDIVKRKDSIDLLAFPNGKQFDVSGARHNDFYYPKGSDPKATAEWNLNYQLLKWVIFQYDPQTSNSIPSELQEKVKDEFEKDAPKNTTIFIVHGIRDNNSSWASQLEERINARTNKEVEVVRSTYGYFSAFSFFFPWLRRKNIRWFQDQYSYHFALNPKTKFHFIGHSNGTYILGKSLEKVPAMKFERVYLAGSVLPCEYNWKDRFDSDQVQKLRNDRSCWDWPVGILCSGLRGIGMTDIGKGGFKGFNFDDSRTEEFFYYNGGHGKPLAKENQPSILDFTLRGITSRPSNLLEERQISAKFKLISRLAPFLAPLLLLLILYIAFLWGCWIFKGFAWDSLEFWLKLSLSITIVYVTYAFAKTG